MTSPLLPRCPALATLRRKPTWANRDGRVDRSACIEVRASEVWPRAQMRPVRSRRRGEPEPEAQGEFEVTGDLLRELHASRLPFALMGDLRTRKANAMKDPRNPRTKKVRIPGDGKREVETGWRDDSMFNPNKGASRTKLLGFFAQPEFMSGWSQRVRLVRWRSHERLAQHFLICPACECKYRKLFAVLCSMEELEHAATAEAWIEGVEARHAALGRPMDAATIEFRAKLIARYALLFRRRRLVCRKCLGMRYGQMKRQNVKTSKRQNDFESDAAREQSVREAERRRRRREQSREWGRLVRKATPELEKVRASLARMRKMKGLVAQFEKDGEAVMRRILAARVRAEQARDAGDEVSDDE